MLRKRWFNRVLWLSTYLAQKFADRQPAYEISIQPDGNTMLQGVRFKWRMDAPHTKQTPKNSDCAI